MTTKIVHQQIVDRNLHVWNDGITYELGTKYRAGRFFFENLDKDVKTVCYDQTIGMAGMAISALAQEFGLNTRIFCRANKNGFHSHQYTCLERFGATLDVRRIAAKSHMTRMIKDWCAENNGILVPFGLKHELVSNAITRAAIEASIYYDYVPDIIVSVMGTGVLNRALQAAFPDAEAYGVAVSRVLSTEEKGNARVYQYEYPFSKKIDVGDIPFPTVANYDAKGWGVAEILHNIYPDKKIMFWNVACEDRIDLREDNNNLSTWVEWGGNIVYVP